MPGKTFPRIKYAHSMSILFLKLEPNELYRSSSPIISGDEVMNNHILCVSEAFRDKS
ncbi:hypothetical protein LguiA_033353 [Lonicera macranthoides]